jgi:hypothetical protein
VSRRFTRLRSLVVDRLPVAASVRVACSGRRRCPARKRTLTVRRGRAVATAGLRRLRFRPGATVEVRITRPGAVTQRVRWRIRRGRVPVRLR